MDQGGQQGSVLQPGQLIRPQTTKEDAKDLVKCLYGLEVTYIKELNSYDDKTFIVKVSEEHTNPHLRSIAPDGYVFKVLNSMDSQKTHIGKFEIS